MKRLGFNTKIGLEEDFIDLFFLFTENDGSSMPTTIQID